METLIITVITGALCFISGYCIRGAVDAHRRRKALERAAEEFAEHMSSLTRRLAESMGAVVGMRVEPEQIKTGDRIHWHDLAAGQGCVDYTAGFNGDTAGKTTGEWIRRTEEGKRK